MTKFWKEAQIVLFRFFDAVDELIFTKIVPTQKKKHPQHIIWIERGKWAQYLWTWRQSVVPNDIPRDFGPVIAFGAKFQIPVVR